MFFENVGHWQTRLNIPESDNLSFCKFKKFIRFLVTKIRLQTVCHGLVLMNSHVKHVTVYV